MHTLSIKQPWAGMIARGEKTIEVRTWRTDYRGPLLIVASKSPRLAGQPAGAAVCVVDVVNCRRGDMADEAAAHCEVYDDDWLWALANPRPVEPFQVTGRFGIYQFTPPQPLVFL